MSNATIYTTDGNILTQGLQTADVCNEAIRVARSTAAQRSEDVVLDDSDGVWLVRPDGKAVEISRAAWQSEDGMIEKVA